MSVMEAMDKLDAAILRILQHDGRTTYDQIGARIGLSASAVLRRARRMEDSGLITGYVALVDADQAGLGLQAYINVRLAKAPAGLAAATQRHTPRELFRASVANWPEVVECAALSGEMDYLLRVRVQGMAQYSHFVMETLLKHEAVQDCKTSFVLEVAKSTTALPV
jgi:Lrp/AsnC family transcriptional regulator, leucine-responsive regulatory protein